MGHYVVKSAENAEHSETAGHTYEGTPTTAWYMRWHLNRFSSDIQNRNMLRRQLLPRCWCQGTINVETLLTPGQTVVDGEGYMEGNQNMIP